MVLLTFIREEDKVKEEEIKSLADFYKMEKGEFFLNKKRIEFWSDDEELFFNYSPFDSDYDCALYAIVYNIPDAKLEIMIDYPITDSTDISDVDCPFYPFWLDAFRKLETKVKNGEKVTDDDIIESFKFNNYYQIKFLPLLPKKYTELYEFLKPLQI